MKSFSTIIESRCTMWNSLTATAVDTLTFTIEFRINKTISIYKKYAHNSSQNKFELFENYTKAEIVIIPVMSSDFLRRQDNAVV